MEKNNGLSSSKSLHLKFNKMENIKRSQSFNIQKTSSENNVLFDSPSISSIESSTESSTDNLINYIIQKMVKHNYSGKIQKFVKDNFSLIGNLIIYDDKKIIYYQGYFETFQKIYNQISKQLLLHNSQIINSPKKHKSSPSLFKNNNTEIFISIILIDENGEMKKIIDNDFSLTDNICESFKFTNKNIPKHILEKKSINIFSDDVDYLYF